MRASAPFECGGPQAQAGPERAGVALSRHRLLSRHRHGRKQPNHRLFVSLLSNIWLVEYQTLRCVFVFDTGGVLSAAVSGGGGCSVDDVCSDRGSAASLILLLHAVGSSNRPARAQTAHSAVSAESRPAAAGTWHWWDINSLKNI